MTETNQAHSRCPSRITVLRNLTAGQAQLQLVWTKMRSYWLPRALPAQATPPNVPNSAPPAKYRIWAGNKMYYSTPPAKYRIWAGNKMYYVSSGKTTSMPPTGTATEGPEHAWGRSSSRRIWSPAFKVHLGLCPYGFKVHLGLCPYGSKVHLSQSITSMPLRF